MARARAAGVSRFADRVMRTLGEPDIMNKILVGLGLVVMCTAFAFVAIVSDQPGVAVATVNEASSTAFWVFLIGTLVTIMGGILSRTRR
jgi:peptidoglycan/LPS O-acetylase OafA/YrhL